MVWDWVIACYLFLAGMGAGAFALASISSFVKPEAAKVRLTGYVVAPIAVILGCLLLMVDARAGLMNPLRFFNMVGNLHSVMAWGVIILVLFIVVSAVTAILMITKGKTPKALNGIGLVLSVCTAAYTGVLLSAAPAFPLWKLGVLPFLFVVSAASSGFAIVLLVSYLRGSDEPAKLGFLKVTGILLPILEAVLVAALLAVTSATTGYGAVAASASVANLTTGAYAPVFWIGFVVIGLVIPLVVELIHRFGRRVSNPSQRNVQGVIAEVCVLVGAFLLRYLVVMAAVPVFA